MTFMTLGYQRFIFQGFSAPQINARQDGVPAGIGAVTTAPGTYGFAALFLLSGAMELAVWTQVAELMMIG